MTSPEQEPTPDPRPVNELTFEQARDELLEIVAQLETGGTPLETSLSLWERGEALATHCQEWLDGARERINKARADSDVTPED